MDQVNQANRLPQDDEIDLFELFETLWDGKWLISAFVVLAAVIGFGYTQVASPSYQVSVPYTYNIYSVSAQQICGGNIGCIEGESNKHLMALIGSGWSAGLSLNTEAPAAPEHYLAELEQHNQDLTKSILAEAKAELELIQTELSDALLGTERVATNMLNAKRVVQAVESGEVAVSFGNPSIVKSSPRVKLIVVLSVVLGGMIGMMFVLLRSALQKRKEQLAKSS